MTAPWNYPIERPATAPAGRAAPNLSGAQRNAYEALQGLLAQWGLQELAPEALRLLQDGHDQTNIPALLQDTAAYKKRFAGNEIRRQKGMPVLSPAEYLSVEQSYRQIMQSNGLPAGFYDQPSDFSDWIGKDVSPQEIQTRVGYAVDAAQRMDAGTKQAFKQFYNIDPQHLVPFFLDQGRALPHIQQQARAAMIGAAGFNAGQAGVTRQLAEHLATSNIADQNLAPTMQQALGDTRDVGFLSDVYGGGRYGLNQATEEAFFQDAEAKRRKARLVGQEQATFAGGSGVGRSSLTAANQGY